MTSRFILCFSILFMSQTHAFWLGGEPDPTSLMDRSSIFEYLARKIPIEEDAFIRASAIIKKEGYPVELHNVKTEDGYILEMDRIPHSREEIGKQEHPSRIPVLFLHQLIFSGSIWVTNLNQSAGFIFSDAGYDVWIGNFRGTVYSRSHEKYRSTDWEYWNYTQHEVGLYDTAAMIDHVLEKTGHNQLYIVVQHGGAVSAMMLLSMRPEYNDKVKMIIGLSPMVTLKFGNSLANWGYRIPYLDKMALMMHNIVGGEIPSRHPGMILLNRMTTYMMTDYLVPTFKRMGLSFSPMDFARKWQYITFAKYDGKTTNISRYPVFMSHFPDSMGYKSMSHFLQLVAGRFGPYDYGQETNMRVYGKAMPDDYNLGNVRVPMYATWTQNEHLVGRPDIDNLLNRLTNCDITLKMIDNPGWIHLDYIYAKETRETCYNHILEHMKKFELKQTLL